MITVYLRPSRPEALAAFVDAVQVPGSSVFHRFIDRQTFVAQYGPSRTTLNTVVAALGRARLVAMAMYDNHLALRVSGTVADIDGFFGLNLQTATTERKRTGIFSTTQPSFPAEIAPYLRGVGGFQPLFTDAPGPVRSVDPVNGPLFLSNITLDPAIWTATGITNAPGVLHPSVSPPAAVAA